MAKKEKKQKVDTVRLDRWHAHLAEQKENNPSVYDTQGGDKQLDAIPEYFV
jgi:hypothetical protein